MIALLAALMLQCPDGSPPPCGAASRVQRPPSANSVAVLYFENQAHDTADALLADGLTEELITRLSQVQRLEVKSRYESRRVRGSDEDPRSLGRSLHAAYIVSGSLQQAGNRVRLNVALVRAATGAQVWGDVYDRVGGDALDIQSQVAREVAGAITGRLLPEERATLERRPTRDPLAYDLYLRGLAAANTTTESGTRAAIALFDQAIARDSTFADAWAQRAWAWVWLADGYVVARDAYGRARESAGRALQLDSSRALAYAVLGIAAQALDLDHATALAQARRAVAASSRDPTSLSALAEAYEFDRQFAAGLREHRSAFQQDTLSTATAWIYLSFLDRLDMTDSMAQVLPHTRGALSDDDVRHWEGVLAFKRGDATGAAARLSWRYYGGVFAGDYVSALLMSGHRDAALAVRDSIIDYAGHNYFNSLSIAAVYTALGDADNAFAMLDRAYEQRTVWLCDVANYMVFRPLRSDPRYAVFMRRLGYAQ
ncbi:MAG TPA: hypothetical protein VGI92_09035 [Gemmatimonadales bacterium]|jgi:TolB-like protein